MHHRPAVSSQQNVVDVADCHIPVASQDIGGGRISPNINVATPNLVSLRRPSVRFVLLILIEKLQTKIAYQIFRKYIKFLENLCPLLPTTGETSIKFYMGHMGA